MIRSEIGIGASLYKKFNCLTAFIDTAISYANETYFRGGHTTAYFNSTPGSRFTVSGLLPHNNLFCPKVQCGFQSPSNVYRLMVNYSGAFGADYTANEVSLEMDIAF